MAIGEPKRLAITIAGAVSLGSYEAGALYELLDAMRQHNTQVAAKGEGQPIYVDVLTGASAGGMTAAILAQKLLFDGPAFVDAGGNSAPWANPLYDTWVKEITLARLLETVDKPIAEGGDPALLSLLSSQRSEELARATLVDGAVNGQIPDQGPHGAVSPDGAMQLGLALTNLTGINYGLPMLGGGAFEYTRFSDELVRGLTRSSRAAGLWQEIADGAVASGAFPVAFRTKDLAREYADYAAGEPLGWTGGTRTFNYTDGGILQNQPLGMAKQLVDGLDGHLNQERRFYLFVSPNPMADQVDATLNEATTNMIQVLGRLLAVYMGQAMFQDWVEANAVNAQVDKLDEQAAALAGRVASGAVDAATLGAVSGELLGALYPAAEVGCAVARELDAARLTAQYAAEVAQAGGAEAGEALVAAIQVLEKSAELSERDRMEIYGVVVDPGKLAGTGIAAFVGFFDERYRHHDYEWGRLKVQELIGTLNAEANGLACTLPGKPTGLGPIVYTPVTVDIDHSLDGLRLNGIDKDDVHTLKEGLTERVNQILTHELTNPVERYPAQWGADLALGMVLGWEFSRDVQG